MRKWLIMLLLPLYMLGQTGTQEDGEGWLKDYEAALASAKENNTNVLVYFTGSDWCAPCKMLKKDLFDTADFKSVSEKYAILYIDIPRNMDLLSADQKAHNMKVLAKHNKKGVFPLFVILNPKGKALDEYSGYSMTGDVQYHMAMFNKYKN